MGVVFKQYTLFYAWIVALVATFGSLYFSEVRGFVPCELCWFQRILMYPLCISLGIASYFNEKSIKKYVLPLTILGMLVSAFHYMKQKLPNFESVAPCKQGIPCSTTHVDWLGFITIPFMAFVAFGLITIFLLLTNKPMKHNG
ncbi:disulfide oxidoreductase [Paenibacillus sp. UMB7766-LJ446]|uniref:disulfide oxidoreductase n=1 Tax=Paenibacillus sp. UMB7766-LJ446 TaxID=3046313 RepID=UPI00254FD1E4|nr:disulfide oxidoreductase [Paenibacillus sp. UMB7766-LJ446]MDK8193078.1 disulfide oxidoreductase [Paenibacillus sp. UMB7766-LJ446]